VGSVKDQFQSDPNSPTHERGRADSRFQSHRRRRKKNFFEGFYKNNNFVVLAINVKDRRQEALAFVKELKLTYPIAFDPNAEVASLYGAWGLPTTYLIGPKGEGLARGWGPAEWYGPAARNLIKELLEEKNGRR
jgi:AhpC/TSA family